MDKIAKILKIIGIIIIIYLILLTGAIFLEIVITGDMKFTYKFLIITIIIIFKLIGID